MERIGIEQLLLLLFFILLPLLNMWRQRAGRRPQRRVPQPPREPELRYRPEPRAPPPVRPEAARERAPARPPQEAPAPRRTRRAPTPVFRTKAELRRAIVLMSILGPCRGSEPPA